MHFGSATKRPNILLIMTDQQRDACHWPTDWARDQLPSFQRLAQHGLTFERAFTNTSMCSPSRATLWTSLFPAETGVLSTGQSLSTSAFTMANALAGAGYQIGYAGKWHLGPTPTMFDFGPWDAPDAGIALAAGSTQGAGGWNNDARYLGVIPGNVATPPSSGSGPSMLDFLSKVDRKVPFFLVASFVNPHDVYVAPFDIKESGYDPSQWATLPISVPATWNEDLVSKPRVQAWFQTSMGRLWNVPGWTDADRQGYARFYAYLQQLVDRDIMRLLDALDQAGLTEDTIIFRIADHGEMGLSHGLVEKAFNAYEETIHVPTLVSNPRLFPAPVVTGELACHIDLFPTIASLAGVLDRCAGRLKGKDLCPLFTVPDRPIRASVHFTFDDAALGTPPTGTPGQIRALRTKDWLYAAYFSPSGDTFDYELYDLADDRDEMKNLASPAHVTAASRRQLDHMNRELVREMERMGTLPQGFVWPERPAV